MGRRRPGRPRRVQGRRVRRRLAARGPRFAAPALMRMPSKLMRKPQMPPRRARLSCGALPAGSRDRAGAPKPSRRMRMNDRTDPTARPGPDSRPAVLDLIGNTPLLPVRRLDTGPCQLFLKLESQNPGGSIKDRIGLSMIEAAERDGLLPPGGTVIEATAGNTGLGLALGARAKGYRVVLVVPDKMSSEKVLQLKALGAEIHLTRSDVGKGHPAYYQDLAAKLAAETPGAWYADQFNNPANPLAHETTTGPEIWQQTGHALDAIVCRLRSGP